MLDFIKSPLGNAAALLVVIVIIGASVLMNSIGHGQAEASFTDPEGEYSFKPEVFKRDIPRFKTPDAIEVTKPAPAVEAEAAPEKAVPDEKISRPLLARRSSEKAPPALPLNMYSGRIMTSPVLPDRYAPFGRLVPCQLAITVESNSIDTPIVGLVTDDVVHAGKVIIPAGAEVHGRASNERSRDRIDASGTWNFVWRTQDSLNGTELTVEGIALDREVDLTNGEWGIRDGSAGLKGYLIKSDSMNEIRLFAASFLAAATQGIKDYDDFITTTGSSVQLAKNTAGNAALDGTTTVLEQYARQIRDAIERDGFYIRVPTGKQFYVYVTQTIDAGNGTRGNSNNAKIWGATQNNEG